MGNKLKWAVIGCGVISKAHFCAVEHTQGIELVAVCDIIKEKAEEAAKTYGAKKVYIDYKELMSDKEIDGVSVCTPSGNHGEICIAAANAKKHIVCEKPIEVTENKIDLIIEAVNKNDVKMECVFQRRLDPLFIETKKAIESGRFGKVILADAYLKYYRDQAYYDSADWRATWELDGGGALMNQCIHGIDLLRWISGDIECIYAKCATLARKIDVEDTAVIMVEYKNGALGVIEGTTSIYPGAETRLEIHCEKGTIIVADSGFKKWEIEGSDEKAPEMKAPVFDVKSDPKNIPLSSHYGVYEDIVCAIKEDRVPMLPPEEGKRAVELILAAYKSSNEGKKIYI